MADYISDVLVVGAGLMGCSTAYHLVKAGLSVVVAEKNGAPGRETTARSGAIIRGHYGVPELVKLALEANKRFLNFKDEVGADSGFARCGYGVLVDEDDCGTLRAAVGMQRGLGVNVELIDPSEFARLVPGLKTHDSALAAFETDGGFAVPDKTIAAYANGAVHGGAVFLYGNPIVSAEPQAGAWKATLAGGATVSAGCVVLTTGNWSKPVGALFGMELPVTPVRAQIVVVERPESAKGVFPVVSDLINLAYFRADGERGMWVGSSDSADLKEALPVPEGFNESVDHSAIDAALKKSSKRFEGIDDCNGTVSRSFCGLYETTPDWQPIIDSPLPNLHVAVGFSGHGFKLAPVIGEVMAGRAAGAPDKHDVSLFNLRRFADGKTIASSYPYRRARFLR